MHIKALGATGTMLLQDAWPPGTSGKRGTGGHCVSDAGNRLTASSGCCPSALGHC